MSNLNGVKSTAATEEWHYQKAYNYYQLRKRLHGRLFFFFFITLKPSVE